jgi:hypothetical protein
VVKEEKHKLDNETVYNFLVVWFCTAERPLLDALVAEHYEPWNKLGLDPAMVANRRSKIMGRLDLFRDVSAQACCSPPCEMSTPRCRDFLLSIVNCAKNYLGGGG